MATTSDILKRYPALQSLGYTTGIDSTLVQTILIPGLAKQGRYSEAASGIELPHPPNTPEEKIEYLSLEEAAALTLDFFTQHNLIRESEQQALDKLIEQKNFTRLANLTQLILRDRLDDPNKLLSSRLTENVARYQEYLQKTGEISPAQLKYYKQLEIYNRLRQQAERYVLQGLTPSQIAVLIPHGMPEIYSSINQQAIISLVVSQLPDLVAKSKLYPDNPELAARAVTNHLRDTLSASYPELVTTQNYLYSDETGVLNLVKTAESVVGSVRLERLAQHREQASRALPMLAPAYSALHSQLATALSAIDEVGFDPARASQAILTTLTTHSKEALTKGEFYSHAAKRLGLTSGQFSTLAATLDSTGLGDLLVFHQHRLSLQRAGLRLTSAEQRLLKLGQNPFLLNLSPEDLRAQAAILLSKSTNQAASNQDLARDIQSRYDRESSADQPDQLLLNDLHSWLDHHRALAQISENRRLTRLAGRARQQRRFFELPLAGKWFEIEERITGRRFIRQVLEKWDHFAENIAIIKLGKTKIPILRLPSWGLDNWHQAKVKFVTGRLVKLRGSTTTWGKLQFNFLRHYAEGGFTTGGAVFSASREFWGKRVVKPAVKWLSIKYLAHLSSTGSSGVYKYLALKAAGNKVARAGSRTATRLLLKLGGKALARGTTKAVAALAAAATAIGGVISAVLAVSFVFDLLRLAYDLVKEAIHNVDFRRKLIAVGAVITALSTGLAFGPIWALLGAIGVLAFGALVVAGAWALGLLAGFTLLFQVFQHTIRLDSAAGQIITSILCNEQGDGGNPRVNTALCIVKILEDCQLDPLTRGNANSSRWQCALAGLVAADAMAALKDSANQYTVLQCVGFVVAVDRATGGAGSGFGDAKTLCSSTPSGWRCVQGADSCAAGDIFVDTGGAWGHTGIVVSPNPGSPYITCADANATTPGGVRGSQACQHPKSRIFGCLKKI